MPDCPQLRHGGWGERVIGEGRLVFRLALEIFLVSMDILLQALPVFFSEQDIIYPLGSWAQGICSMLDEKGYNRGIIRLGPYVLKVLVEGPLGNKVASIARC